MAWKGSLGCFLLWLTLGSTTEIPTISLFSELKALDYGKCFPQHGLMLLHWFSTIIVIDSNHVVQFKPMAFDPVSGYPFSSFANDNHFLPDLTPTTSYFTVGDLQKGSAGGRLPSYVTQDFYNSYNYPMRNQDRIIIRVDFWYNPVRIDRVYLAQESTYQRGPAFGPYPVTLVSPTLFLKIASLQIHQFGSPDFSSGEVLPAFNQNLTLADGMFKEPGLAKLLTLAGYDVDGRYGISIQMWSCPNSPVQCSTRWVSMELKTSQEGNTLISWSGLPNSIRKMHTSVALYKDEESNTALFEDKLNGRLMGTTETTTKLSAGLQLRLLHQEVGDTLIWRGSELDDAKGQIPVQIGSMGTSLQLFTRDGYAGARLYISKMFGGWKEDLYYSWVGFYGSLSDSNGDYLRGQWQWVVYFEKKPSDEFQDFEIYEFVSETAISPELQIRFFENKDNEGKEEDGSRTNEWGS